MNPIRIDVLAPVAGHEQPCCGARAIFKAFLLASTLATGGLMASPADAAAMLITTTGTITSGSETGGLFGLPATTTSLVGDSYTLAVYFDYLGPGYFAAPGGTFADDFETPGVPGRVTATVNGVSLTFNLSSSTSSSIVETMGGLTDANTGTDPAGDSITVSQTMICASGTCIPFANLLDYFSYTLLTGDYGADFYDFSNAAGTASAFFGGTEATMTFKTPEPGSLALLATGLLGLGLLVRRRRRA